MTLFQIFIKCFNCGKLKNSNYNSKMKIASATCLYGTKLSKELKSNHFTDKFKVKLC